MNISELMSRFGKHLGIGPIEPEDDGSYTVVFDDHLVVQCFSERKTGIIMKGVVGTPPKEKAEAEELFKKILKLNLARRKNNDEVLSYDSETREVFVYQPLDIDAVNEVEFEEIMERFVNGMDYWTRSFNEPPSVSPTPFPMMFP